MIIENKGFKIIIGKNVPETDFPIVSESEVTDPREILHEICGIIAEGGFNPISQLVGYIESDDPTHISNYKGARTMINRIDRDELMEDMVRVYIEHLESIYGSITPDKSDEDDINEENDD